MLAIQPATASPADRGIDYIRCGESAPVVLVYPSGACRYVRTARCPIFIWSD